MKFEAMTADIEALCPGLDCVINCNLALINVDKATPVYDEAGLHRARDPAAGSITPYHNGTTVVTRRIPPGGELFKFYGDSWFFTRTKDFGNIPLTTNYTQEEQLLKSFNKTVHILESRSRVNGKDQGTKHPINNLRLIGQTAIHLGQQDPQCSAQDSRTSGNCIGA
jgi:hypothetical protein